MKIIVTETLQHIAAISNPHMKALNEAITAEYPEHPDAMYTVALAFQFGVLLKALDPADRPDAIDLSNSLLTQIGYRLDVVS
jgi:hypothetical protein